MEKKYDGFSMQEAMRLAQSDAGKELLQILQQKHGTAAKTAMDRAKEGDLKQAQQAIQGLLSDPKVQMLLQQLKEEPHG